MDRITEGLLNGFASERDYTRLETAKQFELFASYVCVRRHYQDSFDPETIIVGGTGDGGVDAIAIIVNSVLLTDFDELVDLTSRATQIDVTFVFVQATTSDRFEAARLGNFGYGVADFFKDSPSLVRTDYAQEAHRMMVHIYENAAKFRRTNPICRLFYVSTGRWQNDATLEDRKGTTIADLNDLNQFSTVTFECVDRSQLQELARRAQNSISRRFDFVHKNTAPPSNKVDVAYLGFVPAATLLKLITDEDGTLIKSIFYDNVRDYQGTDNLVNREIIETLDSNAAQRFVLMNNGVTIIARSLQTTGDEALIEDFQIVNGCQTCHSLYHRRDAIVDSSVHVPLKLIHTQDEDVISDIIYATNRQTPVPDAQFIGIQRFPKDLEKFFATFTGEKAVYFERRACQYEGTNLQKVRILSQKNIINAFASMFLAEPHSTTRNHKSLIDRIGETIFNKDDKYLPYYTAAFALYRVEFLIRNKNLTRQVEKFHVLLAARLLFDSSPAPRMNSHEMERYCERMLAVLWDEDAGEALLTRAAEIVSAIEEEQTSPPTPASRDFIRTKTFTDRVIEACRRATESR